MKPELLFFRKSCAYERFFPSSDTRSVLNTTNTEYYPCKLSQLRQKTSESCSDSALFTCSAPRDYTPRATHGSSATASSLSEILPQFTCISENTHQNLNSLSSQCFIWKQSGIYDDPHNCQFHNVQMGQNFQLDTVLAHLTQNVFTFNPGEGLFK